MELCQRKWVMILGHLKGIEILPLFWHLVSTQFDWIWALSKYVLISVKSFRSSQSIRIFSEKTFFTFSVEQKKNGWFPYQWIQMFSKTSIPRISSNLRVYSWDVFVNIMSNFVSAAIAMSKGEPIITKSLLRLTLFRIFVSTLLQIFDVMMTLIKKKQSNN